MESKRLLKILALEQGFYAQVDMIRRRDSDDTKAKDNTKKLSPRKTARTQNCFNIDHEWLKETFMTREPYFY